MDRRILIVDDEVSIRLSLEEALTKDGYNVVTAESGAEALSLIKADNFDLVITDLNMPEMDGLELLGHIFKTPELSDTPVIVITSAGNTKQREKMIKLGAIAILSKPITPTDISDAVGSILSKGESFYD